MAIEFFFQLNIHITHVKDTFLVPIFNVCKFINTAIVSMKITLPHLDEVSFIYIVQNKSAVSRRLNGTFSQCEHIIPSSQTRRYLFLGSCPVTSTAGCFIRQQGTITNQSWGNGKIITNQLVIFIDCSLNERVVSHCTQ